VIEEGDDHGNHHDYHDLRNNGRGRVFGLADFSTSWTSLKANRLRWYRSDGRVLLMSGGINLLF